MVGGLRPPGIRVDPSGAARGIHGRRGPAAPVRRTTDAACADGTDAACADGPDHGPMDDRERDERDERARSRDEEDRERFAARRLEDGMAAQARDMEHQLDDLRDDEDRAERSIEDEERREHWGREPEHPPGWPGHDDAPAAAKRRRP